MKISYLKMKLVGTLSKPGFYLLILIALAYTKFDQAAIMWGVVWYLLIQLNRRTNLKKRKSDFENFDPETPAILDALVGECFAEYGVLNLGYRDDEHITAEDEKKMIEAIMELTLTRMSKTMLAKIKTYYNEELAEDVITKRIYMSVMNYSINNNMVEHDRNMDLESVKKNKEMEMTQIL